MFNAEPRVVTGIEDRVANADIKLDRAYAVVDLRPGNILLSENATREEPRNALTERIPQGFRAVAIAVSAETAVEGWVQPGSRVDVVFTTTVRGERSITTLVENVEVLSAERSLVPLAGQNESGSSPAPVPSLITLLVSTENAARIELAKHTGILSLILRGSDKSLGSSGETITASQLLSVPNKTQTTGTVQVEGAVFGITSRGKMVRVEEEEGKNAHKQGGTNSGE
jgi:pilus assembly protein CpaB